MTALYTRRAAGLVAAIAAIGLVAQASYSFADLTAKGMSAGEAAWRYLAYFTILTNALVAVVMARVAAGRAVSAALLAATTLDIAVVGVAYHTLLAGLVDLHGGRFIVDQILHSVVPLATGALWLVALPKRGLRWSDPLKWLIYPLGYLAYAVVRGHFDGWYPYPFIDVAKLGWRALANGAALAIGFGLAGLAMVAYARRRDAHDDDI